MLLTDKRHKGEVISSLSRSTVKEPAAESVSVDRLSVSEDDNWSLQSSLPCQTDDDDVGCSCARTSYVLPVKRWSGKRKRTDDTMGSKHVKTSTKPMWVDGLGRDTDQPQNEMSQTPSRIDGGPASHTGQVGTPSPTKSSSSAASSPMKLVDKCVPTTKAQPPPPPPPLQPSPTSHSVSRKHSSHETESSVKTRPPDGDGNRRTHLSVTDSGSKTCLNSSESSTRPHSSVTESGARTRTGAGATKTTCSSSAMSPTSAAVSSIVGMSPPATPVMPETQVTPSRRQSKQKQRSQRDPNSLPCKGNTFILHIIAIIFVYIYATSFKSFY